MRDRDAAAVAARAESDRQDCLKNKAQLVAAHTSHMERRQFGLAHNDVSSCAMRTRDEELQRLARIARLADLEQSVNDNKATAGSRVLALESLQREFPEKSSQIEELRAKVEAHAKQQAQREQREQLAARRKQGVALGMTTEEVLQSSWGKPQRVHRRTYASGVKEQWVYGSGNYLYFTDGILDGIHN